MDIRYDCGSSPPNWTHRRPKCYNMCLRSDITGTSICWSGESSSSWTNVVKSSNMRPAAKRLPIIVYWGRAHEIFLEWSDSRYIIPLNAYRSWRSDLPRGACVIVETSVDHVLASLLLGGVRGVVLASRYLIEPAGNGRSKIMHLSRVDIKWVVWRIVKNFNVLTYDCSWWCKKISLNFSGVKHRNGITKPMVTCARIIWLEYGTISNEPLRRHKLQNVTFWFIPKVRMNHT